MSTDLVQEIWGLQAGGYVVVALRYYAKLSTAGVRGLTWDDGLMLLATIVYSCESTAAYMVVIFEGLSNNGMSEAQRAALEPGSTEWQLRVNGAKTNVVGLILYTTLLWLLKGCWVVYYEQLTDRVHNMRRLILYSYYIIPGTYVACMLVAFLKCVPFDKQWQIYPNPGNSCLPAVSTIQTIFVMVMNTLTDFYLMAIPFPIVWASGLPTSKKLSILLMFSGAFLEMAFGIVRAVSILTLGNSDPAESGYWSVRESFVSFAVTNLPLVYPLFKTYADRTRDYTRSRGGGLGSKTGGGGGPGGSKTGGAGSQAYRLSSVPKSGRHGTKPGTETMWLTDSNEHIIDPNDMKIQEQSGATDEEMGMGGVTGIKGGDNAVHTAVCTTPTSIDSGSDRVNNSLEQTRTRTTPARRASLGTRAEARPSSTRERHRESRLPGRALTRGASSDRDGNGIVIATRTELSYEDATVSGRSGGQTGPAPLVQSPGMAYAFPRGQDMY